ncbi:MAG: NAD(P)H-dependent glycerol-3-phosphate dehydrogenase [Sumerlaeia bacterium]
MAFNDSPARWENERVAILGAGSWGSVLAHLLASKGVHTTLWDRSSEAIARLAEKGHPFGVPELKLSKKVRLDSELEAVLPGVTVLVYVVPSQAVGDLSRSLAAAIGRLTNPPAPLIVLASKGIDIANRTTLTEIVRQNMPGLDVAVLSGPCIAREVAQGMPTSVVVSCADPAQSDRLCDLFHCPGMRVYTQNDVTGVELGGALKNVIAIAAGIGDGLGYGNNTKATVLSRGLAEMSRLANAMGARPETMFGLAGLGDLAVTCFSPYSRNRTFGELLGQGLKPDEARAKVSMVVEGEPTAQAALALADRYQIEMPITEAVVRVCEGELTPRQAVEALMARSAKGEFDRAPF